MNEDKQARWSEQDPKDREIVLKSGTWEYKIVPGRKEIAENEIAVQNAVRDPYYILEDEEHIGKREKYVDLIFPTHTNHAQAIIVVVDHEPQPAEVVTAWFTSNVKAAKGDIIYARNSTQK